MGTSSSAAHRRDGPLHRDGDLGAVSLSRLPISQYPEITPPLIQVTTTYVGANALDVEQTVATPIEQQVKASSGPST